MSDIGSADGEDDEPLVGVVAGVMTALILLVAFGLLALDVSWFWIVFPVGFGGLLPAAIGLTRYYQQPKADADDSAANDDPVEALKDRYARGEIDEAEFERRLDSLLEPESGAEAAREVTPDTPERDTARE